MRALMPAHILNIKSIFSTLITVLLISPNVVLSRKHHLEVRVSKCKLPLTDPKVYLTCMYVDVCTIYIYAYLCKYVYICKYVSLFICRMICVRTLR